MLGGQAIGLTQLHPLTLLLAWMSAVVAFQCIPSPYLAFLLITLAVLFFARPSVLTLLRRSRWLLFSLTIMFAFMTPGSALPGWPGQIGMTIEGVNAAIEHLVGLVSIIGLVALLLARLEPQHLILGIHTLLAPFSVLGVDRRKVALRLMLTLQLAAENRKHQLSMPQVDPPANVVSLIPVRWSVVDIVCLAGIAVLMLAGILS